MVELKIKKDDEEITLVDKEDIENALDEKVDNSDLDDYYTKSQSNTEYSIIVEKQSTADTGFLSTYVIKQNDIQKGVKINIPKDFLVKSATVKTCTTANSPVQGYAVGDKYIDFVINSKDSTDTDEHLYLATKEIGAYPVDEITLTVDNGKLAIKDNGITWAKLATVVRGIINGKEEINNKVTNVSASSTDVQYPSAKCVYDTFCQGNDPRLSDARTPTSHTHTKAEISDFPTSMTPTSHTHGNITNAGAIGSTANLPVITTTSGKLTTGSFGTGANTFCQGNDSRLSDARTPEFVHIGATSSNIQDLDNYTTGGFYYCNHDTNEAPYINNCPKTGTNNKSFFLLVETWGEKSPNYLKQTLTYYHLSEKTYIRTKRNTAGWSPWHLVKTTEETVSSTHTTSTSAWTGTSQHLVELEAGTIIYYWLQKAPTTDNVTLDLTLANGDTTGAKNVYFGNSVRLTNQFKAWTVIGLIWDGYNWFVINPYTDTTYTPASNAPLPSSYIANVGSSVKYAREDHVHSLFDYMDSGTSGSAGYTKIIQIKVNGTYQDTPIKVDIAQRRFREQQTINIEFATGNTTDPTVASLTHNGSNNDIYMYKESTSTWSLIVKKLDSYDTIRVKVNNPNLVIAVSNLNTHASSLPTSTTANPLIKSNNVVSNSLSDSSTVNALSANQGKVLNDRLNAMQTVATGNITSFNSLYGASGQVSFVKYNGWVAVNYYNLTLQAVSSGNAPPLFTLPYKALKGVGNYYFYTTDNSGNFFPTTNIQKNVSYSGVLMYPTSD